MVKIKKRNIFVLLIILIVGCGHLGREGDAMKISKEESIKIANKEAKKLHYDIAKMDIEINENNTVWKRYSSSLNLTSGLTLLEDNPDIKTKLENKDFWAVYYRPKNANQFGGDLWVFVDKDTGKVIFYLIGK